MLLWSGVGGQLLSSRGWWSAIVSMLLRSGVGGQLLSACCCGQGLVVSYCHHAVVRGWWSAIIIMLLWSVVGGQLRTRSWEGPFRGAFGKKPNPHDLAQRSWAHNPWFWPVHPMVRANPLQDPWLAKNHVHQHPTSSLADPPGRKDPGVSLVGSLHDLAFLLHIFLGCLCFVTHPISR